MNNEIALGAVTVRDKERVKMLVLSRRESERIRVGDSVVVTVVRLGGDKVRIGIEAPPEMLVLRDELETHECLEKSA